MYLPATSDIHLLVINDIYSGPSGIRSIEIIAQKTLCVTQEEKHFSWKGYGFTLHVPSDSLPVGMMHSTLDIKVSLGGPFELPVNSELISAVYWIYCRHKFLKPVTLDIQHCATITDSSQYSQFAIVTTKCTQKTLPYTFKEVNGGVFTPRQSYGSIDVTHFSGFAATKTNTTSKQKTLHSSQRKKSAGAKTTKSKLASHSYQMDPAVLQYCAKLYKVKIHSAWKLHFVVTKDLEAFSSVRIIYLIGCHDCVWKLDIILVCNLLSTGCHVQVN